MRNVVTVLSVSFELGCSMTWSMTSFCDVRIECQKWNSGCLGTVFLDNV